MNFYPFFCARKNKRRVIDTKLAARIGVMHAVDVGPRKVYYFNGYRLKQVTAGDRIGTKVPRLKISLSGGVFDIQMREGKVVSDACRAWVPLFGAV